MFYSVLKINKAKSVNKELFCSDLFIPFGSCHATGNRGFKSKFSEKE